MGCKPASADGQDRAAVEKINATVSCVVVHLRVRVADHASTSPLPAEQHSADAAPLCRAAVSLQRDDVR
jgi:hypothetical protein